MVPTSSPTSPISNYCSKDKPKSGVCAFGFGNWISSHSIASELRNPRPGVLAALFIFEFSSSVHFETCVKMTRRRSKRKSTVLEGLTLAHGGLRRSKRKLAIKEDENKIYGDDFGILPSD
jgi:hypothetical protein